ncbi:NAD(P)H-dependent oxidoreductase [Saprospira sp. CCB-QB6]|uniref:NADPH-dependent FMN reductase n=1 Tax=Saprospira sp. CCB-QB6 TaxID=3023936 RepID=UPI00234A700A|nr:NAD(P)H-dependent oxidoreductase [Saprospira sp. CCB-QB6]WCL82909.1 NAD(P)H-dependent oxidoreductase [Saprospira sp. CCB-QB6]
MIVVISGTNRPNSKTRIVAEAAFAHFQEKAEEEVRFFSLEELPDDVLHIDMYDPQQQSPALQEIQERYLIAPDKLFIVMPEYNGSYPGVLKLFLDACSVYAYKETFQGGKKAGLVGVAAGRAGNLRGMEHLTGALNYLELVVMPQKLPISSIGGQIDEEGKLRAPSLKALEEQVERFLAF